MTTAADDAAVEDAFEALLAGRPVPEEAAGLAAFTGAVRASATWPGRPNAALAELLATGLLTDQSSPSVRTAGTDGSAPERRRSRVRTRRRPAMIFTALIAKFLSAGAVAQAATGATVAVVAFTGVGVVGALPDRVQDTFATVVAEITPLEPPTSEETTEEVVAEEPVAEEPAAEEPVAGESETTDETTEDVDAAAEVEAQVKAWVLEGPADGEPFGAWVSEGSKAQVKDWLRARGMTFGNVVSAWANGKGFSKEQLAALGADVDVPPAGVVEPQTVVQAEDSVGVTETQQPQVAATPEVRGNGKGNGGNGNGYQGNGDQGNGDQGNGDHGNGDHGNGNNGKGNGGGKGHGKN
jgi:hypothetical protein